MKTFDQLFAELQAKVAAGAPGSATVAALERGVHAVGKKVDWMRENPKVCVEVEDIEDKNHWTTVLIYGEYQELEDTPGDASARKHALDLFRSRPEWWLPAASKTDKRDPHPMVLYRIRVDRVSGRRADRQRL